MESMECWGKENEEAMLNTLSYLPFFQFIGSKTYTLILLLKKRLNKSE